MREDGFFVGAILINVVTTEIVILIIYLVCIAAFGADYRVVLTILFIAALLFPLVFYHHSWSLWLGLDHIIEGLSKYESERSETDGTDDEWPDSIEQ